MAESNKKGMISGLDSLLSISGEEFLEVIRLENDGSYKNYRLLVSKIRNNSGLSAYEIAVQNGFVGSAQDWLDSLEGKSAYDIAVELGFKGDEAAFIGSLKGEEGEVGKSVYEVALENGFIGNEAAFLKTLVGKSAYQTWLDQPGNAGKTEAQFLASIKGEKGDTGLRGLVGPDGKSSYEVWKALPGNTNKTEAMYIEAITGATGESAYEASGFVGTEAQWIASLKGVKGDNGLTAYQVAQANGFQGTQAQWIASLKGEQGLSAYQVAQANGFVGTQVQWLASLEGEKGDMGQGVNVIDTLDEQQFQEIVDLDESVVGDAYIVGTYMHVYNGTSWVKSNSIQGPEGRGLNYLGEWPAGNALPLGNNYVAGDTYVWRNSLWTLITSPTRYWVDIGVPGPVGKSAYQSWLEQPGNTGKTEAEFIASLKGVKGDTGARGTDGTNGINGQDGAKGATGDSAYKAAQNAGFVGTEAQWIASLKGDKGTPALAFEIKGKVTNESQLPRPGKPAEAYYVNRDLYVWIVDTVPANSNYQNFGSLNGASAYETAVELGYTGTEAQWLASLKGTNGTDGKDGVNGKDGTNGTNGADGEDGIDGRDGRNLQVLGSKANLAAIQATPTPAQQDAWVALDTGHLWIYIGSAWVDAGAFRGTDGKSAYQSWLGQSGNAGKTEAEFVASLKGQSAYQTWVAQPANTGKTEAEFLASLKGADGTNGTNGKNVVIKGSVANQAALPAGAVEQDAYTTLDTGILYMRISNAWVNLGAFRGEKGDTGAKGTDGTNGKDGVDGEQGEIGLTGQGINILGEVELLANLPSASGLEVGDAYYVVADGALYQVNESKVYNPGIHIRGLTGEIGPQGPVGKDGKSITIMGSYTTEAALKAAHPTGVAGEGYLVGNDLYLYGANPTTGATEWYNAGPVRGPQGEQGIQGKTGLKGNTGNTGERGSLWLSLPSNKELPLNTDGRDGDWAVNSTFETFYRDPAQGWLAFGKLVAGDVNSPLSALGKVVRLGNQWIPLPVDEVPVMVADKFYVRRLKSGSTTAGEWVEMPSAAADLQAAQKNGKNYVRVFETAGTAPIWKELVIPASGIPEAPTDAGKTYLRSGANAAWVEYTLGEAPTTANKTYVRSGANKAWVENTSITEAPTTAGKTYVRSGANAAWVETAFTTDAPSDTIPYTRKDGAWVAFNRYDVAVQEVSASVALNPTNTQYINVVNTATGTRTVTLPQGPTGRAMVVVVNVIGATGTVNFTTSGGATLAWNGGNIPPITGRFNVITLLWTGKSDYGWIGAAGAVVPS